MDITKQKEKIKKQRNMTIAENPFKIKRKLPAHSVKELGWSHEVGKKWNAILCFAMYLFDYSDPGRDARIVRKLNQALNLETAPDEPLALSDDYRMFVRMEEEFHRILWYHGGISSELVNEIVRIGRSGFDGHLEPTYSVADAVLLVFRQQRWGQGDREWVRTLIEFLLPDLQEPMSHNRSGSGSLRSGPSRSATATTRSSKRSTATRSSRTTTTRSSRSTKNTQYSNESRGKSKSSASVGQVKDTFAPLRFALQAVDDFLFEPAIFTKHIVKKRWFGRSSSTSIRVIPNTEMLFNALRQVVCRGGRDPLAQTGGTYHHLLLVFAFRPERRNNFSALINTCKQSKAITNWLWDESEMMDWPDNSEFWSILDFHFGKEPKFDEFYELSFLSDMTPRPRPEPKGID